MRSPDGCHNQAPSCQLGPTLHAAAGSLVAATLLRCLLQDSVCAQLGSSQAYRLASSANVALESGVKAPRSLTELSATVLPPTTPRPLLPQAKWLAEVRCTCMAAVDRALQLMKRQAGSQLHQALLRKACAPGRLAEFWWTSVHALAEIERASGEPWAVFHGPCLGCFGHKTGMLEQTIALHSWGIPQCSSAVSPLLIACGQSQLPIEKVLSLDSHL